MADSKKTSLVQEANQIFNQALDIFESVRQFPVQSKQYREALLNIISLCQKAISINEKHGDAHVLLANTYYLFHIDIYPSTGNTLPLKFAAAMIQYWSDEPLRQYPWTKNIDNAHKIYEMVSTALALIQPNLKNHEEEMRVLKGELRSKALIEKHNDWLIFPKTRNDEVAHVYNSNGESIPPNPKEDFDPKALQLQAIHVIVAVASENAGKIDDAIKEYKEAVNCLPENGAVRYDFGLLYMKNSQIWEAEKEFLECIKFSPENSNAYSALANCYLVQGLPSVEALYLLAYLDLEKDNNKAATTRARLHEFKPEEIVFPVETYLESQRKDLEKRVNDVLLKESNGAEKNLPPELQLRVKAYLAYNIGAPWASPHFKIAAAFAEKRKYRAAIVHLIQGLKQLPISQTSISLLASCFADCFEFDQAERVMGLVEIEKAALSEKQIVLDQLEHLKKFINSPSNKALFQLIAATRRGLFQGMTLSEAKALYIDMGFDETIANEMIATAQS